MKVLDKFLSGIVIGVILLVIIAFVVVLRRPSPTYRVENTPEGIAHNYLLAVRLGEFERAYGYLSPTLEGYPQSAAQFADDIEQQRWLFRLDEDVSLVVESAQINGDVATAVIQETTFYSDGLFNSNQYTNSFNMTLVRSGESWHIEKADGYWWECWQIKERCP
jgi:hypothetical protein